MIKKFFLIKKTQFLIFFICLFFSDPSEAGINLEKIAKWQNVSGNLMIDTQKIEIKEGILFLILKNKGYQEREFNLNCNNLTGQEIFKNMKTSWKPIMIKSSKYEIAKHLCFTTSIEGFTKERRRPSWVDKIIKNISYNSPEIIPIIKENTPEIDQNLSNKNLDINLKKQIFSYP